jgi:hypothetical protein
MVLMVVVIVALPACDQLWGLRDVRSSDAAGDGPSDSSPQPSDALGDALSDGQQGTCSSIPAECGIAVSITCGGHCYASCGATTNYTAATTACRTGGGDLAIIDDSTEKACVDMFVQNGAHWIGLVQAPNQPSPLDGWFWRSGAPLMNAAWTMGEQNDGADNIESNDEQCGWLHPTGWGDGACESSFLWLCER